MKHTQLLIVTVPRALPLVNVAKLTVVKRRLYNFLHLKLKRH